MDGRKNNGGARPNAGRKPKADEEKVRRLGLNAIKEVYGSVEDYYKHIATESKESFPHLKLLQEYVFGKPKETVDINTNPIADFDLSGCTDEEIDILSKMYARNSINTDTESD